MLSNPSKLAVYVYSAVCLCLSLSTTASSEIFGPNQHEIRSPSHHANLSVYLSLGPAKRDNFDDWFHGFASSIASVESSVTQSVAKSKKSKTKKPNKSEDVAIAKRTIGLEAVTTTVKMTQTVQATRATEMMLPTSTKLLDTVTDLTDLMVAKGCYHTIPGLWTEPCDTAVGPVETGSQASGASQISQASQASQASGVAKAILLEEVGIVNDAVVLIPKWVGAVLGGLAWVFFCFL